MLNRSSLSVYKASAGTGKTYTLAKRYIDLLEEGHSYRSILAITFTNKATAEMKERILNNLYAKRNEPVGQLFDTIVADLDNMKVITIDAFLQMLLNGLSRNLGKAAGYAVDLDVAHAISTAVDEIMTTAIDEQPGLRKLLTNYLNRRLDEDDKWDFRSELIALASELYKESVQKYEQQALDGGVKLFDRSRIEAFRRAVEKTAADDEQKNETLRHLSDMVLLSYIRHRIQYNEQIHNSILISNTARILHAALKEGDADFILEKAGIRYKHILIDEFQDTSDLQWANILKLVQEILAIGGTALIVGDIKQSIYRFRNGNWQIMHNLGSHDGLGPYIKEYSLIQSRRSCREVVRFNLETFSRIAADLPFYHEGYTGTNLDTFYLAGTHEGGRVKMQFYPTCRISKSADKNGDHWAKQNLSGVAQRRQIAIDMFEDIERLLRAGARPQDILILIRKNKQVMDIIDIYDEITCDKERFRELSQHKPVSGDSFRLEASQAVQRVISALRTEESKAPLTIQVNEIIRRELCPDGEYKDGDIAYLNAFQDAVRTYVSRYGSDRKAFLIYWEDTLHNSSIPTVNAGDIRVMTIHSSKGLEARYVFVPYCNWRVVETDRSKDILWSRPSIDVPGDEALPLVPVSRTKKLLTTGYEQVYQDEQASQRVDALNLLYVAFTRPKEELYIYSEMPYAKKSSDKSSTVAHLLLYGWNLENELQNCWNNCFDETRPRSFGLDTNLLCTSHQPTISRPKADATPKAEAPFSFDDAKVILATYHSEKGHIEFRQSTQAQFYQLNPETKARLYGNLCHEILASVQRAEQLDKVINDYWARGYIATEADLMRIRGSLRTMITTPPMNDWFSGKWKVLTERTIILPDGRDKRPDRVMVRGKEAIVLDYKFASPKPEHHEQVELYCTIMTEMGYEKVSGYLYYEPTKRLEVVR